MDRWATHVLHVHAGFEPSLVVGVKEVEAWLGALLPITMRYFWCAASTHGLSTHDF